MKELYYFFFGRKKLLEELRKKKNMAFIGANLLSALMYFF